jgi:hypothetical protein
VSGAEIRLWNWRYTDELARRRTFPCKLTAEAAKHYKDAERIEGTLEIRGHLGSTSAWQRFPDGRV